MNTELILGSRGQIEQVGFNDSSVNIECKVGSYVIISYCRANDSSDLYWNGVYGNNSTDLVGVKFLGGTPASLQYTFKASQASNTASMTANTMNGIYTIIN